MSSSWKIAGVVTTPPRTPERKSRLTRSRTASPRRSWSKRSRSSPSRRARSHRCGSSSRAGSANSASCISQKRPCRPAASAAHAAGQARGWLERTGKWRKRPRSAELPAGGRPAPRRTGTRSRRRRSACERRRRPRTWSSSPTAPGSAPSRGRSSPPAPARASRSAASASKIRLAPGRSPGDVGLVAPAHDLVGPDDHQCPLREATRVVDAERAADLALGLEVRQLLDRHPELPGERRLRPGRVARDPVQRRALRREARRAPPRRGSAGRCKPG